MSITSVVTVVALLVPLNLIAGPEFPSDSRKSHPFCIAGPGDTILMAYRVGRSNSVQLARSTDTGLTWEVLSTVDCFDPLHYHGGHMTLMSDDSILMVVENRDFQRGWIRSVDGGRTWSDFILIPLEWKFPVYTYGPIYEMSDGRWAYAAYAQQNWPKENRFRPNQDVRMDADALIIWSQDEGKTWGDPISIPDPRDGNINLSEIALLEYEPGKFLAAIRSDDAYRIDDNKVAGFDGFYFSRSDDGQTWSTPQPLGDMGRQPHFHRIGDTFVLSYRQYAPWDGTGYATLRFSRDGLTWSRPFRVRRDVQDGPNLVQSHGQVIAFNQLYPVADFPVRQVIEIPDESRWFLSAIVKP